MEARPEAFDGSLSATDLQWKVEGDTMLELVEAIQFDAQKHDDVGDPFIAVAELSKSRLPAGWTRQERWFNVLGYRCGHRIEWVTKDREAREAIEAVESGEGFIQPPEKDFDPLSPSEWSSIVGQYVEDYEFEREEDVLRLTAGPFASDSLYREMRRELGYVVRETTVFDIQTIDAGGRFEECVVEIRR